MRTILIPTIAASALMLSACASDGRYRGTSRDAAIGTAVGAASGAIIAGDGNRTEGAIVGGAIGAAAGAFYGCSRDRVCPWDNRNPNHSRLYTDSRTGQRYFIDTSTGDTYWEDGRFRSPG